MSMNNLSSPFTDCIHDCKLIMRKLRKKIYKHTLLARGQSRRQSDCTEVILRIFHERQIPQFVIESLRKRRNFDITSIKNISISAVIPIEEVRNRTNNQEWEANQLYQSHKQRMTQMRQSKNKVQEGPILATPLYSSTEEQLNIASSWEQWREGLQSEQFEKLSQSLPQIGHAQQQNYFQLNNIESSFNSELALFNF